MIKGFFVTEYFFFSLLKLSLSAQTLDGVIFMPEKAVFQLPLSLSLSSNALTFQQGKIHVEFRTCAFALQLTRREHSKQCKYKSLWGNQNNLKIGFEHPQA